jgi:hypothetical protein
MRRLVFVLLLALATPALGESRYQSVPVLLEQYPYNGVVSSLETIATSAPSSSKKGSPPHLDDTL